jgi:hypothetical protein
MIPYSSVNSDNPEVRVLDQRLLAIFNSIIKNPLLNSPTIVKSILLTSGVDTLVNHGLNRVVTGWIVIDKNGSGDVYQSTTTNTIPNASIILKSTATITVSILFF